MGTEWGRRFARANGCDHPPGIEFYIGHRVFAITEDSLDDTPNHLRIVSLEDIEWLVKEIGPRFAGKKSKDAGKESCSLDNSRSGKAGRAIKADGASYEEMREGLLNHEDDEVAAWAREKGMANGERQLHRIFERTSDTARSLEDRLALEFAEKDQDRFRYVAIWGRWLVWTGQYWKHDETFEVFDTIRDFVRAAEKRLAKDEKPIVRVKLIADVEKMAKTDRQLAATHEQWDADDLILNTPRGIVDLRTGRLRATDADAYCSKMTSVGPADEACPLFMKFLDTIMHGDQDLIDYLQRSFGYAVTGSTREHSFQFCYGTGANGKSVLLNTISGILASYHKTAPIETFVACHGTPQHPTDLAGLAGARFVTAIETEEGRRWSEAKITAITGGDPIPARFMRQDFFEYVPKLKLVIAGNHKPRLRSVNEAIIRRFQLVPFTVTIHTEKRDKQLAEKLKPQWPAILHWMIEGCLEWQRQGLNPPQAVIDATRAYLDSEGTIANWIDDCCELGKNLRDTVERLYQNFKEWAEVSGEFVLSKKAFSQKLEEKGLRKDHTNRGASFRGITRQCGRGR